MDQDSAKVTTIDEQLTFNERWESVFPKGPGLIRPQGACFNTNGSVELNVCSWVDSAHFQNPKTFPDWKTVSDKDLADYYLNSCILYVSTEFKEEKG
jgi:hypothetical protein